MNVIYTETSTVPRRHPWTSHADPPFASPAVNAAPATARGDGRLPASAVPGRWDPAGDPAFLLVLQLVGIDRAGRC